MESKQEPLTFIKDAVCKSIDAELEKLVDDVLQTLRPKVLNIISKEAQRIKEYIEVKTLDVPERRPIIRIEVRL